MDTEPLPWSYGSIVMKQKQLVDTMLDMGTGGGEFLSMIMPLPENTYATEGYQPNISIAKDRLEPIGVEVKEVGEDDLLPFQDDQFELVINRHESFDASEVKRVLKDGGTFVTQQVGGLDLQRLNIELDALDQFDYSDWNLKTAIDKLIEAGFSITTSDEAYPVTRLYDIGAVIYYLKAIPWQINDFSIEKYRDFLFKLHQEIESKGFFDVKAHRFYIIAQKK
ncbi:class I SAM-dependent methyltransferase [Falsibacillus albus]|uniref:Class I SAM-dependent methyltransferase n=2 Tax=Falsibacillus albus TaxID=2478915 RepID=A0A3L7K1D6_9BACI|nr:class I SAM-dependent methyltransferase [Falsibacillus albus]